METKKCSKCGEVKGVEEFHKNASRYDGLNTFCKKCRTVYSKENKDIIKLYRENNKEKIKEINRIWRENNRDRKIKYLREYYIKNKGHIIYIGKKYFNLKNISDDLKPIVETLILLKNKKKYIKKEIQNGDKKRNV